MKFSAYGICDIGNSRNNNEDSIIIGEITSQKDAIETVISPPFVTAVCDGVGGENSGEIASKTVVEKLVFSDFHTSSDIKNFVFDVHDKLIKLGKENKKLFNMQTTMCLLFVSEENKISCVNVGDSRLYVLHHDRLIQVSKDQTLYQFLKDNNREHIFSGEKENIKHIIVSSIGNVKQFPVVDLYNINLPLEKGDCFLLCSDGITDFIKRKDIKYILSRTSSSKEKATEIFQTASDNGSNDNLSVIVLEKID